MGDRLALAVIDAEIAAHRERIADLEHRRAMIVSGDVSAAPGAASRPVADDTWPPDHRTLNFGDRQLWTDTATAARIANVSEDEMRRLCKTYPIALRPRGRWFVQKERLRRLLASGDLS